MRSIPEITPPKAEDFLTLLDKRIVRGYSSLWTSKNSHDEKFLRGAWKRSIDMRGPKSVANQQIKFLRQHNQGDPLSLFEDLFEDEIGLGFRTKPLDPVDSADRVLVQLRSGTLNNYSNGFLPIWSIAEYDEKTDTIIYPECELFELSVVGLASDSETFTVRSKDEFEQLYESLSDEIKYFIKSLPQKDQLEARFLFARQKSLFDNRPQDAPIVRNSKKKSKIDYTFLNTNI